jgi:hypothetical protein
MTYRTLTITNMDRETFDWTTKISENDIAFIISDSDKVVYVWNGQKASNVKKYKGGTLATKIKSLYQLYGYKTTTVNQGEEVGSLKAEIGNLLAGHGTAVTEEGKGQPKVAPAIAEHPVAAHPAPAVPAPASRPPPARAAHVEKAEAPAIAEPAMDKRVKELETELENEKKKSAHKYTKLKEEMDAAKENYEKQIAALQADNAAARKGTVDVEKYNTEIAQIKGEKDSLNVLVEGLKNELEAKEAEAKGGAEADKKIAALQAELDDLKGVKAKFTDAEKLKTGLEKKNAELASTVSSLQAEVAVLKAKAESAEVPKVGTEEIDGLKAQIESLQKSLDTERKNLDAERKKSKEALEKISESEEKLTKLETKAASAKEESKVAQRKLIEQKEAAKQMDGLDFASLDEVENKPAATGGASLAFVNPYSGGEVGGEIDPLTDLRSFLNTVDPSKPLDPELKSLLDIVSKKIETEEQIIPDLQKIKKKVKDKKLESLLDATIKKIKTAST